VRIAGLVELWGTARVRHGIFNTVGGLFQRLGKFMATGITAIISPQAHRRIDQLTFPGLIAAAALMARWDRRAASIVLMTAGVEGVAHVTTDYPPAILPLMSFRTHNRIAIAHGAVVIALGLTLPGISPRGRWALCALGAMPITLAALSDTRERQPIGPKELAASSSS
jgi:hypothetical protein